MTENNSGKYFGSILHRERKKLGVSLKELAKSCGEDENGDLYITDSYLSRLENGTKSNPTIDTLGRLIEALSLDVREVFGSFNLEHLLPADSLAKITDIADIIRLCKIKAPLETTSGMIVEEEFLSAEEKEILISIIKFVFSYGINDTDKLNWCITNIIKLLDDYRIKRTEIIERYRINTVTISNSNFEVLFSDDAMMQMKAMDISKDIILDAIKSLGFKLFDMHGNFFARCEKVNGLVYCSRVNNRVNIQSICDNIVDC